jgi:ubiquitin C-terminal hydrolase
VCGDNGGGYNIEDDWKCPSCKGKPTKYKIKDIQVKDNNFIIYKGALTNKRDLRTGWKYK